MWLRQIPVFWLVLFLSVEWSRATFDSGEYTRAKLALRKSRKEGFPFICKELEWKSILQAHAVICEVDGLPMGRRASRQATRLLKDLNCTVWAKTRTETHRRLLVVVRTPIKSSAGDLVNFRFVVEEGDAELKFCACCRVSAPNDHTRAERGQEEGGGGKDEGGKAFDKRTTTSQPDIAEEELQLGRKWVTVIEFEGGKECGGEGLRRISTHGEALRAVSAWVRGGLTARGMGAVDLAELLACLPLVPKTMRDALRSSVLEDAAAEEAWLEGSEEGLVSSMSEGESDEG